MSRIAAFVALCTLAACATQHRILVTGKSLRGKAPALQRAGRADVPAEDVREGKGTFRATETLAIDQLIGASDEKKPVRDWIAGCEPGATCALDSLVDAPIEVRRFETRSAKPVIGGVVFGVGLAGLGTAIGCGFACADGSDAKRASEYTMIGYGVVLGAGLVWGLITCFGGRTCRD